MGDDMDFFGSPPSDEPVMMGDDAPIILAPPPPMDDDMGVFLGDVNEAPILLGGGDDAPIVLGPPGGDDYMEAPMEQPEGPPPEPVGPSPMQKWNEEWQDTLKQRKDEENARKAELVEQARADLEKFQLEREQRREGKMAKNREDEQAKLEAIEADLENDNSWQRVCKMVELSHDSTKQAQDVKRMRDILINLKNDAGKADSLS